MKDMRNAFEMVSTNNKEMNNCNHYSDYMDGLKSKPKVEKNTTFSKDNTWAGHCELATIQMHHCIRSNDTIVISNIYNTEIRHIFKITELGLTNRLAVLTIRSGPRTKFAHNGQLNM